MLAKKVLYGLVVMIVIATLSVGGLAAGAWRVGRAARNPWQRPQRDQRASAASRWSASAK